jgi:[ribosomal protein S18]-alanine N-acetyltransferase
MYGPAHLRALRGLFRECFPEEEWQEADFSSFTGATHQLNIGKVVVDRDDQLLGAVLYTLEKQRCRVRRIAVASTFRQQGIATWALGLLCGPRSVVRRPLFSAKVPADDLAAQRLFRRAGFLVEDPAALEVNGAVSRYEFNLRR